MMSEGTLNVAAPALPVTLDSPTITSDSLVLPVRFSYTANCRTKGLTLAALTAGLLVTGLFLLSQISTTPAVAVQLCAVGLMLTAGGAVAMHQSAQRLLGALAINDFGIHQSPGIAGFSIPWNRLSRWEVREHAVPSLGLPVVRFWAQGDPTGFTIPADSLTHGELRTLRRILRHYAPERELTD